MAVTPLRLSSIPHEYYHGNLQGTLQYNKTKEELVSIPNIQAGETLSFVLDEHSLENKKRLLPHTKSYQDYTLLLVMKREFGDEIWLKGALQHKETGKISLMTTTNSRENITSRGNRALKSNEDGWFVGFYRMAAPMCFWKELKNRLEN